MKQNWESDRMRRKQELAENLNRVGISDYPKLLEKLDVVSEDDKALLRSIITDQIYQNKRNKKGTTAEEELLAWLSSSLNM